MGILTVVTPSTPFPAAAHPLRLLLRLEPRHNLPQAVQSRLQPMHLLKDLAKLRYMGPHTFSQSPEECRTAFRLHLQKGESADIEAIHVTFLRDI